MPISEARVPTRRPGRYLTQLGRHAQAIGHRPGHGGHDAGGASQPHPRMLRVEQSDTTATLEFDRGRCTLDAEPDALVLRIEAPDATSLAQLERLIGSDLERFGNRDQLTVTWHRSDDHRDGEHDHHGGEHDRHGGDHDHHGGEHDHHGGDRDQHGGDHPHGPGDAHAQGGDHGHAHRHGGVWGRVRHALVPHSHDSADRVDTALENSRRGVRTLVFSFLALSVTAVVQLVVVLFSGSVALLGDTVHNAADSLTALPVGVAFVLGRRAATRRHTYGLGRAEDLAGVVVVLVIAASAVLAGYAAVRRLLDPQPVHQLWVVAAAGVIGFAGNELVARWRVTVGRRIGSAALVADGLHARADGFASLAVVLGAAGVAVGIPLADPVIGLAITVGIAFVAVDAARQVFGRLMDAVDPGTVAAIERAAAGTDRVDRAYDVRVRWVGHSLRAELAVAVDATLPVGAAHRIAHEVEHRLIHAIPRLAAAIVHTEPADAGPAHGALAHHRTAAAPA
ncbi:DUF2218 domain-containing protein [Actinocatenispora comari]|uniref:Cation diffusion facilitator family transporter n=1 Tax=Actinocatenispora comari TaxID=2807577 RepID=A0A8J4ERY2_9ACTN|nr:DUF2218 domain-containing protein [Actinocatenispora comari]GIL31359.1 hypothetical protein NUM_66130 [Actinocatenispora comari]